MYLIDDVYLKQYVHVEQQLNNEVLTVAFNEVQRMYILPLLGQDLLDAFLTIVDTKATVTGKRKQLLNDVRYYFALRVHHTLLGFANIKTSNRGSVQPDGAADLEVLIYERGIIKEKYETVKHDIELLIKQFPDDFPEYYFVNGVPSTTIEKPEAKRGYSGFVSQIDRVKKIGG